MDKYIWTPEGKELLLTFQLLINQYGGCEKLAYELETELTLPPRHRMDTWDKKETIFLLKNINLPYKRLGELLQRTPKAIERKVFTLRRDGSIASRYGFKTNDLQ